MRDDKPLEPPGGKEPENDTWPRPTAEELLGEDWDQSDDDPDTESAE